MSCAQIYHSYRGSLHRRPFFMMARGPNRCGRTVFHMIHDQNGGLLAHKARGS